jgi:hypothetical protein
MVSFLLLLALSSPAFGLGPSSAATGSSGSSGNPVPCGDEMLGDGTPENPYQICKGSHLYQLHNYPEAHFVLVNDIDFTYYLNSPVPSFSGTIDGRNHTISNFYPGVLIHNLEAGGVVKRLRFSQTQSNCFYGHGVIAHNNYGTIDQVVATDITVRHHEVDGNHCGGLVGINYGTVKNSVFTGTLPGGSYYNHGGIAAVNKDGGIIQNCMAIVEITGSNNLGGIVGINEAGALVEHSIAIAKINAGGVNAGGIVGWNAGIIKSSLAMVDIYYRSVNASSVGKIQGYAAPGTSQVINSYAFGRLIPVEP